MKAFIIHLPKSKKSLEAAKLTQSKIDSVFDVELFQGTDKYEAWNKYINSDFTLKDVTRFGSGYVDSELGAFFSHYSLWNKCLILNQNILILEHDADLINHLDMNIINSWDGDILNLGLPNWGSRVWKGKGIKVREVCGNFHNIHDHRKDCQCNTPWLFGAHAYIISPTGAKKLVAGANKEGVLPADTFIRQELVEISDYLPHSFKQRDDFTFIQVNKKYKDDNKYIKFSVTDDWDY